MSVVEKVLSATDWNSLSPLSGSGADLASALQTFLDSESESDIRDAWFGLENAAFAQGEIFDPAPAVIDVMMAALTESRPLFVRLWILEVLRFILRGESGTDPSLAVRCRSRARLGVWLLVREAHEIPPPDDQTAILLVQLIDPALAEQFE